MKKRFIVSLNGSTKKQEEAFIKFLGSQNVGWWHWLSNTWLISDNIGKLTASTLNDKALEIFESEHLLVLEINNTSDTWAGFGPSTEDKNMFSWLKNHWKKNSK